MTSIDYLSLPFDYYNYFSINIIDYGEFTDSETNTHFDAKDMISSGKGKAIEALHYIGDKIWDYGVKD